MEGSSAHPDFPINYGSMNRTMEETMNLLTQTPNVSVSQETKTFSDLSHNALVLFYTVNYAILTPAICIIGIVTNVLNAIVFSRQGFQATVNISLFAMAISDLASLVTLLYLAINFGYLRLANELSFYPVQVQVLFGGWPHVWFLRITAWLTAFISLERCLCVYFPLKVKVIFTPTKVKVAVVIIYLLVSMTMAPTYYYTRLGWRFDPARNRSMLGLTFTDDRVEVERVTYIINSVLSPLVYFCIILLSTVALVVGLNRKSKWRMTVTSQSKSDGHIQGSNKDRKVVKMVITIATIFIVFLMPSNVVFIWQTIEPELYIVGKYQNMFNAACSVTLTLEAISSSLNILVYYKMSSNYKATFKLLFCKQKEHQ